jgi:hypothetical protein
VHAWLFSGEFDRTTRRLEGWLSNTLVLPMNKYLHSAEDRRSQKARMEGPHIRSSRRWLDGAVFDGANLTKADLIGAHLQPAPPCQESGKEAG